MGASIGYIPIYMPGVRELDPRLDLAATRYVRLIITARLPHAIVRSDYRAQLHNNSGGTATFVSE